MLLGKKRKLGRNIEEIQAGEKLEMSETIEDKDLLLYLGLTNDNNPLFIQHDYASMTPFKKPIVPQILLTGMITAAVSKYLPGPGSSIKKQSLSFPKPVYHYGKVNFLFEVTEINQSAHSIMMKVEGKNEKNELVIIGDLEICPPYPPKSITSNTLENF
ncbi:MaoC/PaaZ C-terminal domain-containing protein [Fictibacillus terranigra]|uniref:MaoC/PaaZ C-terminal domain-containing protein n=1 Tax=Fictibacillus terranigra TaxID=3058424 RepID=A0ABT8E403_9BACL|nr:MaoC/PaaZ C-terminal domain-containing protein [Fictibacillus sp. CENA-BCM004]MDN4072632.1 MaoC/PaaZ C-terminal domain-containing protein [Fictibacillus sp. CENA-BCM004]